MIKYKLIFDNNKEKMISSLDQLIIKEKVINDMSIELYGYEEPCILERTFIVKKIILEIESTINTYITSSRSFVLEDPVLFEKFDMGNRIIGIKAEA